MSKTKETKGTAPKSNAPLLIIGVVAIVAIVGGWYWYNTSKSAPKASSNSATNSAANRPKAASIPPNAPPGANPPNQSGSPTAAVTIEEFADFQCGSCAAAHPLMNEIKSTYGSKIKFVFRNFPLALAAHDKAYDAAVATEAAGFQGKFWDMQNILFTNQQAWTTDQSYKKTWKDYAARIGLDVAKWENDMAGLPAKERVNADMARGKAAGVNSTPTIFINGVSVPVGEMNVPGLRALVDAELAKTSPAAPASN